MAVGSTPAALAIRPPVVWMFQSIRLMEARPCSSVLVTMRAIVLTVSIG